MQILKIAAFCDGNSGGNPGGVMIENQLPTVEYMQSIAAEVGNSENCFCGTKGK